jgi:hypothetical protein
MSKNPFQIKPFDIPPWVENDAKAIRFVMLSDTHSFRLLTALFRSLVAKGLSEKELKESDTVEEFTHWFAQFATSLRAEWGLVFMYQVLANNILHTRKPFDPDDEYFGGFIATYLSLNGAKNDDEDAARFYDLMADGWACISDDDKREMYQALLAVLTSHAKSELISIGTSKGATEADVLAWAKYHGEKNAA